MGSTIDDDALIVPASQGYHAGEDCVCVAQPSTGVEVLLTGMSRRIWEVAQAHRGLPARDLVRFTGGDPEEIRKALAYLCDLGVLEAADPGGW